MKHLIYQQYFMEPASQRFKSMAANRTLELVFDFISEKKQVDEMIAASNAGRPAMEAVIEAIEVRFPNSLSFDIEFNFRQRQILGSMIRFIMGHYNYWPGKAQKLKKGRYVKTAIVYTKGEAA